MSEGGKQSKPSGTSDTALRWAIFSLGLRLLVEDLSHDLKGPMNSMALHLELIKRARSGSEARHIERAPERGLARSVDAVEGELTRLGEKLERLIAYLRPARSAEIRGPANLLAVLQETLALAAPRIARQRLELAVETGKAERLVAVSTDALRQALLCVFMEAFEGSHDGGRIELRMAASRDGSAFRLDVQSSECRGSLRSGASDPAFADTELTSDESTSDDTRFKQMALEQIEAGKRWVPGLGMLGAEAALRRYGGETRFAVARGGVSTTLWLPSAERHSPERSLKADD